MLRCFGGWPPLLNTHMNKGLGNNRKMPNECISSSKVSNQHIIEAPIQTSEAETAEQRDNLLVGKADFWIC